MVGVVCHSAAKRTVAIIIMTTASAAPEVTALRQSQELTDQLAVLWSVTDGFSSVGVCLAALSTWIALTDGSDLIGLMETSPGFPRSEYNYGDERNRSPPEQLGIEYKMYFLFMRADLDSGCPTVSEIDCGRYEHQIINCAVLSVQ